MSGKTTILHSVVAAAATPPSAVPPKSAPAPTACMNDRRAIGNCPFESSLASAPAEPSRTCSLPVEFASSRPSSSAAVSRDSSEASEVAARSAGESRVNVTSPTQTVTETDIVTIYLLYSPLLAGRRLPASSGMVQSDYRSIVSLPWSILSIVARQYGRSPSGRVHSTSASVGTSRPFRRSYSRK